jgi:hypothetical protein
MAMTATVPERARGKRWLKKLGLALGSFVLCLVLFEVALRLNGYGNLEIYQPDPKLYWRLKPNQDCFTKVGHQPVHINFHGTRGPEFTAEKPANSFRILSLGDSRTFGWGLADEETYSRRLEKLLAAHVKAHKPLTPALSPSDGERENHRQSLVESWRVEVINAGVNAWSFPQMQVFFRDVGLKWSPDFVILAEANLWTQFSEKNSDEFVKKFMSRVRLKNLLRRSAIYHFAIELKLQAFYQRYRTKFIPVDPKQDPFFKEQQQRDPDAVFRSAIEDLCRTAQSNGVKPVLLFVPTLDELSSTNQSRVLAAKQAASAKLGVPLVDLTPDLTTGGKALYLEADPVHLNAAGNEVVAGQLFETIPNLLAR